MQSITCSSQISTRLNSIDQMRALGMALMAIFHFSYDLRFFGVLEYNLQSLFWVAFRGVILTLFFVSVGASLYLAHGSGVRWRAFRQRELKIVMCAVGLSFISWLFYPQGWIWFGVLHFIGAASVLSLPLLYRPILALILGVTILLLYNITSWFNLGFLFQWSRELLNLPTRTVDLTRLIPWISTVYIGIYLGHKRFFGLTEIPLLRSIPYFAILGRRSFSFYLLHQIVLFPIAWLIAHWL